MNSPLSVYICPSCDAHFDAPSRYCRQCGSSMDACIETDDTLNSDAHELASATTSQPAGKGRRVSDRDQPSWLGRIIDNRYRVIEAVGRGGMGMVYKVEHQRMGKIAAMKVLHQEFDDDPEIVERFQREAEAVSRLTHPNTVQVFDFGRSHGSLYLIMELVRGQSLSALLSRDGAMPFARSGPMLMQVCAAVAEAHSKGVIHRDIKPENVLVTRTHRGRDFVKVLDFGLAKLSEREETDDVTKKGLIVGTPYYMSPEQIRGEDVDERTDVYSMGALMYRVLTGKQAFTAKTPMGVLTQHLTADLVKPSLRTARDPLHPALDDIIMRAMAKEREQRFASMEELLDALESAYVEVCTHSSSSIPGADLPSLLLDATTPSRAVRQYTFDESDEIDYGIISSVRLQRSDLDAFERSLSRRRFIGLSLVPLVLCGVAGLLAYLAWHSDGGPRSAEHEPNNQLDDATLIAPGTAVTGFLGKRMDRSRSDHDFYRVAGDGEPAVVTAHVSALPNIDIELSLLDATGKAIAHADEGVVDHDEWIRRYRVRGPVYVLVTEARKNNLAGLPTENISDPYTLTVDVEPASEERETEPNETPSDAHPLRPSAPVTGHLDHRLDTDSYRFDGDPGAYQLTIDGAADVPLTWSLGDRPPSSERTITVRLERGDIIQLSRRDRELAQDKSLPGVSAPYTIQVAPARTPPGD